MGSLFKQSITLKFRFILNYPSSLNLRVISGTIWVSLRFRSETLFSRPFLLTLLTFSCTNFIHKTICVRGHLATFKLWLLKTAFTLIWKLEPRFFCSYLLQHGLLPNVCFLGIYSPHSTFMVFFEKLCAIQSPRNRFLKILSPTKRHSISSN